MSWGLFGHEWASELLREHVVHDRLRHAYLFTGPQGIGRRTLALRLAQALNCPQPLAPGEPCQACHTCLQIERMQHPDLAVVQSERVGGVLKVEQVRELQRSLSLAPYQALYRIAILLRFEESNLSASNAFLKTLEEPPPKVVLVLTAESAESLLPTIVSRCEVLRLRPSSLETVEQGLQNRWDIPEDTAHLLAHLSGGRVGYALRLHQDPERMEQRNKTLEKHRELLTANRVKRFAGAESMSKDKDQFRSALEIWQSLWRDVYLYAVGSSAPLSNLDRSHEIESLSRALGPAKSFRMVSFLQRAIGLLDSNSNARLIAEVLMLELPHLSTSQS